MVANILVSQRTIILVEKYLHQQIKYEIPSRVNNHMRVIWFVSPNAHLIAIEHSKWPVTHPKDGEEDAHYHNQMMHISIDQHYQ